MANKSLGTLTVDLVAKSAGFVQGMDQAERSSKKWRKSVENDLSTIAKSSAIAATAIGSALVGAVVSFTKEGLSAVDSQNKLAKSLNTSYDSITQLNKAFDDAGIKNFETSLDKLNKAFGAAELGRGTALKAIKELNLDLKELSNMDTAERVATIADRIRAVATSSQQAAQYAKELGFEQREAAQFFLQGGDAIRQAGQYVRDMGLAISDVDAEKVELANSSFQRLRDHLRAISQTFAVSFAPLIAMINKAFADVSLEIVDIGVVADFVVDMIVDAIGYAGNTVQLFKGTIIALGKSISLFGLGAQEVMLRVAKAIVDFPIDATNKLISLLNKIPKVNITASFGHFGISEKIANELKLVKSATDLAMRDIVEGIVDTMDEGWSSDRTRKLFNEFKEDMIRQAQEMVDSHKNFAHAIVSDDEDIENATKKVVKSYLELKAQFDDIARAKLNYSRITKEIADSSATEAEKVELLADAYERYQEEIARPYEMKLAPEFSADTTVFGKLGALFNIEKEREGLEAWYREQAGKQQQFLDIQLTIYEGNYAEIERVRAEHNRRMLSLDEQLANGQAQLNKNQMMATIGFMSEQASVAMGILEDIGQEQSGVYKTLFLLNRASAIANAIVSTEEAAAKALTMGPIAGPVMANTIRALGYMSVGVIAGQTIAGMAHDGISNIPKEGTWLLDKGERVVDKRTNYDLKEYLASKKNGADVIVNVNENPNKAGEVAQSMDDQERTVIDIFVADIMGDGRTAGAIQSKWGLLPQGI